MSNVTSIFKNKPDPEEYIPSGLVLMAMDYFNESDPQLAWDQLVRDVLKEARSGDEEVCKKEAAKALQELPY